MKGTPNLVNARWHFWETPYDNYTPEQAQCYEPSDDFRYRCDDANEVFYSVLEPKDISEILTQIRAGTKIEVFRLHHFTDEDADCVAQILELNALEDYGTDLPLIAACHRTYLESPLIAELLIIHCLSHGDTIDDIMDNTDLIENFYADQEELEEDFLPFLTMCNTKRLATKLT